MSKWSLPATLVMAVVLFTNVSGQQNIAGRIKPAPAPAASGEVLVQFSASLSPQQRSTILAGASRLRRFETLDIEHYRLAPGSNVDHAINTLRKTPGVRFAQPNYIRKAISSNIPNDPFFVDGSLWGLNKIQAPSAWSTFTAGNGTVVIADIDTGIDYTHPDLAANVWRNPLEVPGNGVDDDNNGYVDDVYGIDTANHDSDPMDDQGHGTHTSGTIAAVGNNGVGVAGVSWNAKLLSCKFLDASGFGTDAGAIECFNYIVALKIRGENLRVSSNSWGAQRGSGPPSTVLQAAIDAAGAAGIINVFGAGNDGSDNDSIPFDPASYDSPSIVAVASSGPTDRRSFFSNYGATSVDIAAPGEDILSTYPGGAYEYSSGTSMATPHVAGAAALLASMDVSLSVEAMKALLLDNVDKSSRWNNRVVSGGRLNVFKAASAVGTVPGNIPPSVVLTQPAEGATFKAPVTIGVSADASDSDGTITSVTFYANGAPIGTDATSPYSVAWSPAPGVYSIAAVAKDNGFATTTSAIVHITVLDNDKPTVSITSPLDGSSYDSPATLTIDATAADTDGTVTEVAFFANGQPIGTDATAPFSVTWAAAIGTHALTAVAKDNFGATTTSTAVTVLVGPIPGRINVALAANGGVASASSTFSPSYPASGANNGDRKGLNWGNGGGWNDGTQNAGPDWLEVRFAGMKLIEEINVFSMQDNYTNPVDPTPTMTFTLWGVRNFDVQYWDGAAWKVVPGGAIVNNNLVWRRVVFAPLVTSKIRVHITAALNGYSRLMEVEAWGVGSGANAPPTVSISTPASGASFVTPADVTISAVAVDDDGAVTNVAFYANGTLIGADSSSPYSMQWSGAAPGSYTLTAVATDNQGATTTSEPVSVTIAASNVPPTVFITAPAAGASFISPVSIVVDASAADSDGSVASVQFFANGSPIGTDTAAPYSVTWPSVPAGNHTLTAVATDNNGATSTSAGVPIVVAPMAGRLNVALASNGAVATASSVLAPQYPPSGAINGDRRGLNWGNGGGWNDGTPNTSPDWIEVALNGSKSIDEINVFSMQDNYTAPIDPTPTMTFTLWGLRNFDIQYWDGAAWQIVPGGAITNNTLVWRRVTFAPITTSRIRVWITGALQGYSRVIEVEAWGAAAASTNVPPTVSISAPLNGASFTAPATITIDAAAGDSDGTVAQVAFYAGGNLIGTDTSSPYSFTWSGVEAGSHQLTAVATDNLGATTTSSSVTVTVAAPATRSNVALAANGGVATASSILTPAYGPSGAINGDRRGLNWGNGGGWNDGTQNAGPDWIEVAFNDSKTINEINVFSMQDAFTAPVEPTPTMTFTTWGLRAFEVQYWTGAVWATVPGGSVTNNNLVWRQFVFSPITTTRIRVWITAALNGYARVIELEAWDVPPQQQSATLSTSQSPSALRPGMILLRPGIVIVR